MSVYAFVCVCWLACVFVGLSVWLMMCLLGLFRLCVCSFVCLCCFVCLSVGLSKYLFVCGCWLECVFVCLSVGLFI